MDNSNTNLSIMERVKTFDDAFNIVDKMGMSYLNREYYDSEHLLPEHTAYLKLRIICAALNEGWTNDITQYGNTAYLPFFRITNIECVMTAPSRFTWVELTNQKPNCTCFKYEGVQRITSFPKESPMLHLKSQELAEYCGKQFIELWKSYYTNDRYLTTQP